ncbi:hypothetical protein EDB83DRAFT_2518334 [Lactarius deliciosus]|nr:hypothetical protein EDB83DRAFT_2518334 [Lactarius deliciosus]
MFKIPGSIARRPLALWSSPYLCVHTSTPPKSSSVTPQTFNSLDGLPLTILPEHARMKIMIPRAHSVTCTRRLQIHALRKTNGCYYEEAAVGVHGLLASLPAAVPTPATDSGAYVTTNSPTATATDLQDASLDLRMDLDILLALASSLVTGNPLKA